MKEWVAVRHNGHPVDATLIIIIWAASTPSSFQKRETEFNHAGMFLAFPRWPPFQNLELLPLLYTVNLHTLCAEGFRAAPDLECIWKALQAGQRLSELFMGFNISFDSLDIKLNCCPSKLCDIFRTRAKKPINVSVPFSCFTLRKSLSYWGVI